ncbi:sigma-70 family RNA polymerase sigma factor [Aliifodinibius salicampi]|uniref:Sigma-70 family RNA polymerase sigma factor n=1 Tax=Fodinibius salicampi TaxID=1920655 RepID=A0ABT3PW60_9BACT|nr:sigma-70 family RNA polymerase sigma factor [Fodinibius salicampi]MCW9712063.1 sigma-70 family RNA polymerase sigma factor [Fodinibius salicampi]
MAESSDVTRLLISLKKGEDGVYDKLYPLIYDELRNLAYSHMNRQSADHTLSRTELVHETYLKMIDQTQIDFSDRSHFLAIASRCMRQILIDYARKKQAEKRGGKQKDLTYIDGIFNGQNSKAQELIDIDDALKRLAELNERLSKVVEMRFLGEMTIEETADALDISESTVKRDWMKARGWLYKELKERFEVS